MGNGKSPLSYQASERKAAASLKSDRDKRYSRKSLQEYFHYSEEFIYFQQLKSFNWIFNNAKIK